MSRSFFKTAVLAFAFTEAASATLQYTLATADDYTGTSFWDGFNFITTPDPTFGFVEYQSRAVAESNTFGGPLIKTFSNGSNYMGVDYWNSYSTSATGRPSVRIETTKQYQYGLFVADLAHMPASVCGTWPAFWTVNHVNYPSNGEIDILENINENTQSLETLHTTAGCSVVGNMLGTQQNAKQASYNCDDQATYSNYGSQSQYQGCSATNSDPNSYGSTFNANSGGVYAMEWTSEVIQIWNFGPNNIPSNLKNGNPDTSTWGTPQFTTAQGSCDIDAHFQDQQVVFNTDFCGSYAGLDYFWQQTSCYKSNPTKYATCVDYVAANPAMYENAFWTINSLKVYQKTNVVSSSSSSTQSSTTSSTSSSTSKTSTTTTSSTSTTTSTTSTTSTSSSSSTSQSSTSSSMTSTSTSTKPSTSSPSSSQTSTSTTSTASSSSSSSQATSTTTSKPSSSSTSTTPPSSSTSSTSSPAVNVPTSSSSSSSSSLTPSTSPTSTQTTYPASSPSSSAPSSSPTKGGEVPSSSSSSVATSSGTSVSTYASSSSVPYSNTTTSGSTGPSGTSSVLYTTSTVLSTRTYTITSCAATVTNCPAKLGQVTTDVITLYTTVCPVTATETSSGVVSTKSPYSPPPPPESVTSTVYTTKVYTITSCAPTVTNCPAKLGQVTTEIVSLYTTVCPYTPQGTHPAYPIIPSSILASSPVSSPVIASSAGGVLSSPASSPTVVIVKTETVQPVSSVPVFSTISKVSNSTVPAGTSGAPAVKTSTAGGVSASESPIYSTSGASEMKVKGAFAVVLGALVMLM